MTRVWRTRGGRGGTRVTWLAARDGAGREPGRFWRGNLGRRNGRGRWRAERPLAVGVRLGTSAATVGRDIPLLVGRASGLLAAHCIGMIIHQLIARHLQHRDDAEFYALQARDAIRWIEAGGGRTRDGATVLDLGCGHGVFGVELAKRGCVVTFSDEHNVLVPELAGANFTAFNIDRDDFATLGRYDLVVCSNVLEHLPRPAEFIGRMGMLLQPGGRFYLSWTNWLSPWGGHEFSPFHYLGATRGHLVHDRLGRGKRSHTPFVNLFPTYIGEVLRWIDAQPGLRVVCAAPRYYTELAFLLKIPVLREFLAWNCALLIEARGK